MLSNTEIDKLILFLDKENNWYKSNIDYWKHKKIKK